MEKRKCFRLKPLAYAVMLAFAAPAGVQLAYAGAGVGSSTDATGTPKTVPTYYANSPAGTWTDWSGVVHTSGTALRKFVDQLSPLGCATPTPLGQCIPVAVPDKTSYAGSDYYELGIVEYTERMHSDLPKATTLRGYVQLVPSTFPSAIPLTIANGLTQNITDAAGNQLYGAAKPHYLGPTIVATKGIPVRIKYTNLLPKGHFDPVTGSRGGDLFLPVDTTLMGAGEGPLRDPSHQTGTKTLILSDGVTQVTQPAYEQYTQNRAEIHLHGGDNPWISDGTPYQWTTPAGEATDYKRGASFANVPDMPDPGDGSGTLFFTNNQSGRLMFYHDHASGITRLNVYAGIAAGYLINDPAVESTLPIPADQIPLIIQDKTFVPDDIAQQDAKWDTLHWGQPGDLWFPHVYETNQDPTSFDGTNPVGRWDWGPWFWPVFPSTYALPTGSYGDATTTPEAFMDTAVVNGTVYPTLTVEPKAYRFRMLNVTNDRFLNLGLYLADSTVVSSDGRTNTEVKMVPAAAPLTMPLCSTIVPAPLPDPVTGLPTGAGTTCWPDSWPADGRDGGVPDPATAGPKITQIGTEGGLLPSLVDIPSQPTNYEYNRRSVTVLNVFGPNGLYMGPAERADAIIDFSQYAGKTLIVYNDAPAPNPGFDPRIDYYTDDPDQTAVGGAAPTLAGFGPNTRTVMQIVVAPSVTTPPTYPTTATGAFDETPLSTALPAAYAASQAKPIVPQTAYNAAFGQTWTNTFARIYTGTTYLGQYQPLTFVTPDAITYKAATAATTTEPTALTTAAAGTTVSAYVENKAIQELFEPDYGRMNATLGVELPFTTALVQTTIPLGYIDPSTEYIANGETQFWKITHNGVDAHPVHFHLVNVQVINRIGWDGTVKPPAANEVGWKDTVKMNPLEDIVVAARAKQPVLPGFGLPQSVRPMDPSQPLGTSTNFTQVNPKTGNPATVTNALVNFDNEYVWHCHILGHEENDFMRAVVLNVGNLAPAAPTLAAAVAAPFDTTAYVQAVSLNWTDNSTNEYRFDVQRAVGTGAYVTVGSALANGSAFTDTTAPTGSTLNYRVAAVGAGPVFTASNVLTVTTAGASIGTPTNLAATVASPTSIALTWRDRSNNETGFIVERSDNGGAFTQVAIVGAGVQSYTDATAVSGATYTYRVKAYKATAPQGVSQYSNYAAITDGIPLVPTGLTATAARLSNTTDRVTLNWTDNANNETGFVLQQASDPAFTTGLVTANVAANSTSIRVNVPRGMVPPGVTYYFRIQAVNVLGASPWSIPASVVTR